MSQQWRILVVEDEENLNWSIVNSLRKDDYFVQGVMSGAEAIRILWTEEYDVVISDLKMPGADGFELLQWVRTHRPKTRLIMVTAFGSASTRTQALEGGVVSYLEKPFDLHTLKEELRRLLQQTGFSASLDSFDLLDVIQIITMSRKSIALLINTGLEERGVLRFQGGELIWAEYGSLRGEEAFFALAAHKNGVVVHQPWNEQIAPNVTQPLSRLIFQALQYRTKYASIQQHSGEHEAVGRSALALEEVDDSPFLYLAEPSATASASEQAADEAWEWWQRTDQKQGMDIDENGVNGGLPGNGTIIPSTVRKMPASQRTDLPSWLTEQPTAHNIPALRPSSLSGSAHIPVTSVPKASPAGWQPTPVPPVAKTTEHTPRTSTAGPQTSPATNTASPQLDLPAWQPSDGQPQASTRNYSTMVSALQTLGYSIPGFVATAVIMLDGQPIAQVAVDDLDIAPLYRHFSSILQGVLRSLEHIGWRNYEDTVITSADRHILLRLVGNDKKAFQVLVTTREADPLESLEMMANVEGAIGGALR